MHVEDAAIYDVTFELPTLRQQLGSAQGLVVENLRQLPAVGTICNAAIFEGSSSGSNRIIGDATGKGPTFAHNPSQLFSHHLLLVLTRFGNPEIRT